MRMQICQVWSGRFTQREVKIDRVNGTRSETSVK